MLVISSLEDGCGSRNAPRHADWRRPDIRGHADIYDVSSRDDGLRTRGSADYARKRVAITTDSSDRALQKTYVRRNVARAGHRIWRTDSIFAAFSLHYEKAVHVTTRYLAIHAARRH